MPAEYSDNPSIETRIKAALATIDSPIVESKFRKNLRNAKSDHDGMLHVYRELLFGEWAVQNGLSVEYQPRVDGLTPDWLLTRRSEQWCLEVLSLHDGQHQKAFTELQCGEVIVCDVDKPHHGERLLERVMLKCSKYERLSGVDGVILGVHLDFDLCMTSEDLLAAVSPDRLWEPFNLGAIVFQEGHWPHSFSFHSRPLAQN